MKIFTVLAANILCFAVVFCVFHTEGLPSSRWDMVAAFLYIATPVINLCYLVTTEVSSKKSKPAATDASCCSGKSDSRLLIIGHDVKQI